MKRKLLTLLLALLLCAWAVQPASANSWYCTFDMQYCFDVYNECFVFCKGYIASFWCVDGVWDCQASCWCDIIPD